MAESPIEHVVVLMLENRSFDHIFGFLDHPDPAFKRLRPGDHPNPVKLSDPSGETYPVQSNAVYDILPDPPHSHLGVLRQMNIQRGKPHMNGFADAYAQKASGDDVRPMIHYWRIWLLLMLITIGLVRWLLKGIGDMLPAFLVGGIVSSAIVAKLKQAFTPTIHPGEGADVMRCLSEEKASVLSTLAKEFVLFTRWHCSVPGETWPNRNFAHAGTSDKAVNIELGLYDSPTVFERLQENGKTWGIYRNGKPHVMVFRNLWTARGENWFEFDDFKNHVPADRLPHYSFIEPRHDGAASNSQHPGNNPAAAPTTDFQRGESLVAEVYEALRSNPDVFNKTLFLITYDEHGGFFDREPPPNDATPPDPLTESRYSVVTWSRRLVSWLFVQHHKTPFDFKTLGPRVPAILVSPRVPKGKLEDRRFDHTSIIATLAKLFAPKARLLSRRVEKAETFENWAWVDPPRPIEDLPDLSGHIVSKADVLRGVEMVGVEAATPERDDAFGRQLEGLADLVDQELTRRGASPPPRGPEGPDVRELESKADVMRRFQAFVDEQKAGT